MKNITIYINQFRSQLPRQQKHFFLKVSLAKLKTNFYLLQQFKQIQTEVIIYKLL